MSKVVQKPKLHLITINPPAEIQTRIRHFKEVMKADFKAKHALKLPAHITLQRPFWTSREKQDLLRQNLKDFSGDQSPFVVQLRDFGCFPSRVIYVNIANPKPLIALQQSLQSALSDSLFIRDRERQSSPIIPHITIATRDLKGELFPKAWSTFKDQSYSAHFHADAIILFQHDGKFWHPIEGFAF